MSLPDVLYVAGAVLGSVGGAALIIVGLSSWLGKVWATRILEKEKAEYSQTLEKLKGTIAQANHQVNVVVSRLDKQRSEAIHEVYQAIVKWHEVALELVAPQEVLHKKEAGEIVLKYAEWGFEVQQSCMKVELLTQNYALYFTEDSYQILGTCGTILSNISNDFRGELQKVYEEFSAGTQDENKALEIVIGAKSKFAKAFEKEFTPNRIKLVAEFRKLIHPPAQ